MTSAAGAISLQTQTTHLITPKVIQGRYRIHVFQPMRRTDATERFPVVYSTDAHYFWEGLANAANFLTMMADTEKFILVGIGHENAGAAELLRWRDFAPPEVRDLFRPALERAMASPLVSGIDSLDSVFNTTDAGDYLSFIVGELMPFIDAEYPTIPGKNSYFGYSAGGSFGLYTLFNRPESFQNYILGSPGTSNKGRNFAIQYVETFLDAGRTLDARAYMSVGELEENKKGHEEFELTSGFIKLVQFLTANPVPGLTLETEIFSKETHASAWMPAFTHGLRSLLKPRSDLPTWLGAKNE